MDRESAVQINEYIEIDNFPTYVPQTWRNSGKAIGKR